MYLRQRLQGIVCSPVALDAPVVHVVKCLLVTSGLAAVGHSRVQGRHLLDRVRELLGAVSQVFVQPAVALPPGVRRLFPEPLSEVLAHQWVGVQVVRLRVGLGQESCLTQTRASPPPLRVGKVRQRIGQGGDGRRPSEDPDLLSRRGSVEQPNEPKYRQCRTLAESFLV